MKKYKITPACLPSQIRAKPEFEQNIICIALKKLVTNSHYNICDLDKLIKIFEVQKIDSLYAYFSLMHCVDYKDMGEDVAEELIDKTLAYLGIDVNVIDVESEVISRSETPSPNNTRYAKQEDGYPLTIDQILDKELKPRKIVIPKIGFMGSRYFFKKNKGTL